MILRVQKSKTHEENMEITFIKSDVDEWYPEDEDKGEETTSFTNNEAEKSIDPSVSCNSLEVNFDNNSVLSELSSVSSLDGPIEDIYCKRRNSSSKYRINNRNRVEPSILNHFLDLLSTCFWKCSTGCQQLPDKRY